MELNGVCLSLSVCLGNGEFTERDVEIFRRYLTFCGIGIQNAQLFEISVQEFRRNQTLLNLARSIFEEQNNLECLVTKILTEARELLKCQRSIVFLLDLDCCESVSCCVKFLRTILFSSICFPFFFFCRTIYFFSVCLLSRCVTHIDFLKLLSNCPNNS